VAVLVTRPAPDHEATAAALRDKGIEAIMAPLMRCEAVAFADDGADYAGVIVTSANALRAIEHHPVRARLLALPLFTVGEHSAAAAKAAGVGKVVISKSKAARNAAQLAELVSRHFNGAVPPQPLLYLAGAEITRDVGADLTARGFPVVTRTVYRMAPLAHLPKVALDAFAAGRIEAVLHYSRRSAQAFLAAARIEGVEISALALPHCCLSDAIAEVLRDAGAARVVVARNADEPAMIDAVMRALPAPA
jgi:uroporphyrinogen-III synthase